MWGKASLPRDTLRKDQRCGTDKHYKTSFDRSGNGNPLAFTMGVGTHLCFMDRRKDIGHESGMFFYA
jgi:hypothetical protein